MPPDCNSRYRRVFACNSEKNPVHWYHQVACLSGLQMNKRWMTFSGDPCTARGRRNKPRGSQPRSEDLRRQGPETDNSLESEKRRRSNPLAGNLSGYVTEQGNIHYECVLPCFFYRMTDNHLDHLSTGGAYGQHRKPPRLSDHYQ